MKDNIFAELEKYPLGDCKTVIFDEDIYTYLKDKHHQLNSDLAIKEAASWEAATKLVLTD